MHIEHELLEVAILDLSIEAWAERRVVRRGLLENAAFTIAGHETGGHLEKAGAPSRRANSAAWMVPSTLFSSAS